MVGVWAHHVGPLGAHLGLCGGGASGRGPVRPERPALGLQVRDWSPVSGEERALGTEFNLLASD